MFIAIWQQKILVSVRKRWPLAGLVDDSELVNIDSRNFQ